MKSDCLTNRGAIKVDEICRRIFQSKVTVSILYIAFFIPYNYVLPAYIYLAWKMVMLTIGLCCIVMLLINRKFEITWSLLAAFFILFYLCSSLSAKSDGTFSSIISSFIRGLGFVSLCQLSYSYCKENFLIGFATGGTIMTIAHLISVLIYFNVIGGMRAGYVAEQFGLQDATTQHWYLLTYDNESIFYILPTVVALILVGLKVSKVGYIFASIIGIVTLITYFIQKAVAAEIASIMFVIGLIILVLVNRYKIKIHLPFRFLWSIGLIFSAGIVLGVVSGLFGQIGVLLGKDPTFSGRVAIWSRAINEILSKPLLGHGIELPTTTYSTIWQTHCHNIILEILYTGGIITLITYILVIISLRVEAPIRSWTLPYNIVSIALLCIMVASSIDWSLYVPIPFVLIYLIKYCDNKEINQVTIKT